MANRADDSALEKAMNNKAGQTIYSEEIYFPCEFRVRQPVFLITMVMGAKMVATESTMMPTILTGWVQNEVHLQWGHQSLQ